MLDLGTHLGLLFPSLAEGDARAWGRQSRRRIGDDAVLADRIHGGERRRWVMAAGAAGGAHQALAGRQAACCFGGAEQGEGRWGNGGRKRARELNAHPCFGQENKMSRALFSSQKILQNFSHFLSHRIFRRMHEVLNIDENKN